MLLRFVQRAEASRGSLFTFWGESVNMVLCVYTSVNMERLCAESLIRLIGPLTSPRGARGCGGGWSSRRCSVGSVDLGVIGDPEAMGLDRLSGRLYRFFDGPVYAQ